MKNLFSVITLVVAGLFAGCSEQTGINGPISSQAGAEQLTKPSPLPMFDINTTVVDPFTNDQYHVFGHVDYGYANSNGDYTFGRRGKFSITHVGPGETYQFLTSDYSKGKASVADPANITDVYPLDQVFPGLSLSVDFLLSDGVTFEGVQIQTRVDVKPVR